MDTKGEKDKEKLSVASVLLQILKEEGIAGYYRGFTATMINTFSMRESPSIPQINSSMRFVPPASGYTLRDPSNFLPRCLSVARGASEWFVRLGLTPIRWPEHQVVLYPCGGNALRRCASSTRCAPLSWNW